MTETIAPEVTVVVPVRNEALNVEPLVREIEAACGPAFPFEVVYVDDGSSDATAEILTGLLDGPGAWTVELSACRQIHTALVQVLLRYRPAVHGEPADPFLSRLVLPALTRAGAPAPVPAETAIA